MIRKFGRLEAPSSEVAALFARVEDWPQWMPGVESLRVLEGQERRLRVEAVQVFLGRRFRQELEVRLGPASVAVRQLAGTFRRWEATWRFQAPPAGEGTTVRLELDFDLGLLEWLSPRSVVQGVIDRHFAEGLERLRQRLCVEAAAAPEAAAGEGEVLLQVFEVDGALEVVFGPRRVTLPVRLR